MALCGPGAGLHPRDQAPGWRRDGGPARGVAHHQPPADRVVGGLPARAVLVSDFGRWLDERMRARGISQRALAVRSDVSHGHISRIRRGAVPSVPVADRLARGLGETFLLGRAAVVYVPDPVTDAERTRRR